LAALSRQALAAQAAATALTKYLTMNLICTGVSAGD
jgi:hypothetical protein